MDKSMIKYLAEMLGINTHDMLFRFFERNAGSVLEKKISQSDAAMKRLVQSEDERYHYGDTEVSEKAMEEVLASFTLDRIAFIRKHSTFGKDHVISDLGDSNGIFLRSSGRNGVSVNISDPAVLSLHMRGMETLKAHIEHLPFRDNSIHTLFLFETLEHVPNPISLLNEIGRVCSNDLILSIPFVEKTKINPHNYDPSRPIYQHHIFEFNQNDFASVISHTPFVLKAEEVAIVMDEKRSVLDRLVFYLWHHFVEQDTFCGCFKRFYICKLSKKSARLDGV
jgi:SAM-dependent methyltransferase